MRALLLFCLLWCAGGQVVQEAALKFCNSSTRAQTANLKLYTIQGYECWVKTHPATRFGGRAAFRQLTAFINSDCPKVTAYDGSRNAPCPMPNLKEKRAEDFAAANYDYVFRTVGHFAGQMRLVFEPKDDLTFCTVEGFIGVSGETTAAQTSVIIVIMVSCVVLVFVTALTCSGVMSKGQQLVVALPSGLYIWSDVAAVFCGLSLALGYTTWAADTGELAAPILIYFGWALFIIACITYIAMFISMWVVKQHVARSLSLANRNMQSRKVQIQSQQGEQSRKKRLGMSILAVCVDLYDWIGDLAYAIYLFHLANNGYGFLYFEGAVSLIVLVLSFSLYLVPSIVRRVLLFLKEKDEISPRFLSFSGPMWGWLWEDGPNLVIFLSANIKLNCTFGGLAMFHISGTIIGLLKKLAQSVMGRIADTMEDNTGTPQFRSLY